ncbi:hypothetical protein B7494_g993 [Chlorociboria aeruginascens]|nr:hypothetical protein B7494_g993 [Chlorociboria aeruginascens]
MSEPLSSDGDSYTLAPPNSPTIPQVDRQLLHDFEAHGPRPILELFASQCVPILLEDHRISSCSELTYIPTPFNSPQINPSESNPSSIGVTPRAAGSFTIGEDAMAPPPPTDHPRRSTRSTTMASKGGASTASSSTTRMKNKSRGNILDDPNRVLTNTTSPIYHVKFNLKAMLQLPETERALESEDCAFKFSEVNSDELATAAAAFKEDGRNGFNEPEWMRQASEASKARAAGNFDDYTRHLFQQLWAEEEETLVKGDKKNDDDDDDDDDDDANGKYKTNQRPSIRNSRNHSNHITSYDGPNDNDEDGHVEGSATDEEAVDPESVNNNTLQPVLRPPKYRIMNFASDMKLETMCGPQPQTDQLFLQPGDKLQLLYLNRAWEEGIYKEAEVVKATPMEIIIKVAPRGFPHLSKHDDLNCQFTGIMGVDDIIRSMRNMDPETYPAQRSTSSWKVIKVFRGGEELGTLHDIRQALLFSLNEFEFSAMRNFRPGRKRRVHKTILQEGYTVLSGCMFKKIHKDDMLLQNPRLILDLGHEIMAGITSCADEGYRIFMVDNRIRTNDGIPVPMNAQLADVYERGPNCFPTPLLRQLAGCAGWTGGFAHQGPLSLGKGWGCPIYSKGRAVNNSHPPPPLPEGAFLTPLYVPKDLVPCGVQFTEREEKKLLAYCTDNVFGKLQHYPTMRSIYHRTVENPPTQQVCGVPTKVARGKGPVRLPSVLEDDHKLKARKSLSNELPKEEVEPPAFDPRRYAALENIPQVLPSMTPHISHALYIQPDTQDNHESRYPPVPMMSPPRQIVTDRNGRWYSRRAYPILEGHITNYNFDGADDEFSDSSYGHYSINGNDQQVSGNNDGEDDDGYWFIEKSYPELSKEHRGSYFDMDGGNDGIPDADSGYHSLQNSRPSTSSHPSLPSIDPALYEMAALLNACYHIEGCPYLPQQDLAASVSAEPAKTYVNMSQDLHMPPCQYESPSVGSFPGNVDILDGAHSQTEKTPNLPQLSLAAPNATKYHDFGADIEQYLNQLDELAEKSRDTSPVRIPECKGYDLGGRICCDDEVNEPPDQNLPFTYYNERKDSELMAVSTNTFTSYPTEQVEPSRSNPIDPFNLPLPFPDEAKEDNLWLKDKFNPDLYALGDSSVVWGSTRAEDLSAPRAGPIPDSLVPRQPYMNPFSSEKKSPSYQKYAVYAIKWDKARIGSANTTPSGMTPAGTNFAGDSVTPSLPVKRGRGRPRKYPLPVTSGGTSGKTSSPAGQVSNSVATRKSSLRKVEYAVEDFQSESSPEPLPDKRDRKDGDYNPRRSGAWYKKRKST